MRRKAHKAAPITDVRARKIPQGRVYIFSEPCFVQGGDLSAALLLPASVHGRDKSTGVREREVCKPPRESISFNQL